MATLIAIAGLPGSGKAMLIDDLAKARSNLGVVAPDYMKESIRSSPRMDHSRHFQAVVQDLRAGRDCIVADVEFVRQAKQVELEQTIFGAVPHATIEWLCFKNDPEKCIANVERRYEDSSTRGDHDVASERRSILEKTCTFHVPANAKMLEVYPPSVESDRAAMQLEANAEMRILYGKVSTRYGIAAENLAPVQQLIASRMGLPPLAAGTLNVKLPEQYIVQADALIEAHEYKYGEILKLQRCRVNGMQCCIMRPDTHEAAGAGDAASVLEIMAAVKLRTSFNLKDGDPLDVEVEGGEAWWEGTE